MATIYQTLIFSHDAVSADVQQTLHAEANYRELAAAKIKQYVDRHVSGVRPAAVKTRINAAKASGTITFSGTGAANDTVIVNGVTFTAVASGATGNQWNVGASATLSGDALAAAINASATALVVNNVTAANVAGVVTITAVDPGTMGNCVTIAEGVDASSHMAVSGARLTGGTNGDTETTHYFGSASSF
jgi:phage tail sheath gpL-like